MPIDRKALVARHRILLTAPDAQSPLSVGNGEFAFTCDITGLQTFPEFHMQGMAQFAKFLQGTPFANQGHSMQLGTQAQWGWHTMPNPHGYRLEDVLTPYTTEPGTTVTYPDQYDGGFLPTEGQEAGKWLHTNPQRIDLGRIGLVLRSADQREKTAVITDLSETRQTLDLWEGLLHSSFLFAGLPVQVWTVCHPQQDLLAVRIESPLLLDNRLAVQMAFPYASDNWLLAADWNAPERHTTRVVNAGTHCTFTRILDNDHYAVALVWQGNAQLSQSGAHQYQLSGALTATSLEFVVAFAPEGLPETLPTFSQTQNAAAKYWEQFWTEGAAVEFAGSSDPRAHELERRVVLSQYLTALNCAGSLPPQETGLVCNSWNGKFHLEMHWWHAAHFLLWQRKQLFERSLPWYQRTLAQARETARRQGYQGARWPKQVGPDGRESPSKIGAFLIWQQPHPIYYAELAWRAEQTNETLERYRELVFETAAFMASFARKEGEHYILASPLVPAQEAYWEQRGSVVNPTFELAYWFWGLEIAQRWRTRLALDRDPNWERVRTGLAAPMVRDNVYTAIGTPPYTLPIDHPSMLGALGFVPQTPLIDPEVMRQTLHTVLHQWDWSSTWGWDYPLLAMCAARLGEPELALDLLLKDEPKNTYLTNGHNRQIPTFLPLYLPGNGGLLSAIALMAAGWDGSPDRLAPGFPARSSWSVQSEGLLPLP